MKRVLLAAGVFGAAGVLLGAYGAHGLEKQLVGMGFAEEVIPKRLATFDTGVRYQMHVAIALAVLASLHGRVLCARGTSIAAGFFVAGTLVFSGLLYALAFVGPGWRWLGAVVPIGGVMLVAGWVVVALEALRSGRRKEENDLPRSIEALRAELIRLEEAISHQQKLLQDLDEVVTVTRDSTDESSRRVVMMETTVKRLVDLQQAAEDSPDERPPHY